MNAPELLVEDLERLTQDVSSDSPVEFSMFYGGQKLRAAECNVINGRIVIALEEVQ